jgi:hypothetical protein
VFVDDLPHGAFRFVQDLGHEEQQDENHRSLIGQGKASVLGLGVCSHLAVDVIVLDSDDYRLDKLLYF